MLAKFLCAIYIFSCLHLVALTYGQLSAQTVVRKSHLNVGSEHTGLGFYTSNNDTYNIKISLQVIDCLDVILHNAMTGHVERISTNSTDISVEYTGNPTKVRGEYLSFALFFEPSTSCNATRDAIASANYIATVVGGRAGTHRAYIRLIHHKGLEPVRNIRSEPGGDPVWININEDEDHRVTWVQSAHCHNVVCATLMYGKEYLTKGKYLQIPNHANANSLLYIPGLTMTKPLHNNALFPQPGFSGFKYSYKHGCWVLWDYRFDEILNIDTPGQTLVGTTPAISGDVPALLMIVRSG